jgi:hypothetical protein
MPVLPYTGKHLWLWQLAHVRGGDPRAVAAEARRLGLAGVLVKYNDGAPGPITAGLQRQFRTLAPALRAEGLVVGAWGYVYGEDPRAEAELALAALDEGADWYVFDAESPFESRPPAAWELARLVRSARRGVFGYASFALPKLHPAFPYDAFDSFVAVFLPMVYWGAFRLPPDEALEESLQEIAALRLKAPVAPVGQLYGGVPPSEVRAFLAAALRRRLPGVSFFDFDSATEAELAAVQAALYPQGTVAGAPAPPAPHDLATLAARLESMSQELAAIAKELKARAAPGGG